MIKLKTKRMGCVLIALIIFLPFTRRCQFPGKFQATPVRFYETVQEAVDSRDPVYIYKNICDTVYIQDSARNIKLVLKSAFTYNYMQGKVFFRCFLPWTDYYTVQGCYGITLDFDYWELKRNYFNAYKEEGIKLTLFYHNISYPIWDREVYDKDSISSFWISDIGGKMDKLKYSPDTIFVDIRGNSDTYITTPDILIEKSKERHRFLFAKEVSENYHIGQMILVKTDSIIPLHPRKKEGISLFMNFAKGAHK